MTEPPDHPETPRAELQFPESVAPHVGEAAGSPAPITLAADRHRAIDPAVQDQTIGYSAPDSHPPKQRSGRTIDRWRIFVAVAVLLVLVVPGAAVALIGLNPGFGKGWNALILLISGAFVSFLIFLLFVYVIAYVVSAAWHDAQNHRRRSWR